MTLVVTPSHRSNRVPVPVKHSQALPSFRVPEPDIASAGKELSLVGMPSETLDMDSEGFYYLQAAPGAYLPDPDRPIPAT